MLTVSSYIIPNAYFNKNNKTLATSNYVSQSITQRYITMYITYILCSDINDDSSIIIKTFPHRN